MESKKFMLGDEPKSYPPAPPSQMAHGHEEQRTTTVLSTKPHCNVTAESTHTNNNSGKRPTRHLAKRRSSGTRFMKRSTSMEDTTKARMRRSPSHQRLQTFSPLPIMTQLPRDSANTVECHECDDQQSPPPPPPRLLSSRNDSNSSTSSNRTAPSSFIVSSMECAKPIEQTFHATGKSLSPRTPIDDPDVATIKNNQPLCSSATKALRNVSSSSSSSNIQQSNKSVTSSKHKHQRSLNDHQDDDHSYQRSHLVSHFIQQQNSGNNLDDDNSCQKMMDDQYRDLQHYYHPMLASLTRCLAYKINHNSDKQTPAPKSAITPKTQLPFSSSSSSSAFFVPATSSSETAGRHHHRHHSHAGDATIGGRHLQHQQLQQQQQLQSIHADQRQVIHKNHMKKILLYNDRQQHMHHHHHLLGAGQSSVTQHGPSSASFDVVSPAKRSFALSMASSSSASTSSPWVTSIWDRVWNGLIKA